MRYRALVLICLLCGLNACIRKSAPMAVPSAAPSDNSYLDLTAGSRLRILVPLLKPGDSQVTTGTQEASGNTLVLTASNLIGYQTSYYFVEGHSPGQVRLRFIAAQVTRDGKTEPVPAEPRLPFALPTKAQHVRLIYYIRNSESDHNMAIAASKDMNTLVKFTKRLESSPEVCLKAADVFCSWVPAGVAVRPE